ncbi:MAG: DUF4113 domain-containing protein [Acidobacteria bacterium]|nr:DUF4113 domain-containing protein [Acidobacteriota bacterium]
MQAVDQINARRGRDAVRFAASDLKRGWTTLCAKRSSRYMTSRSELLTIG